MIEQLQNLGLAILIFGGSGLLSGLLAAAILHGPGDPPAA